MTSESNPNVGSSCSDSVSFPNTRKQTTTNMFEMGSKVFRFQPVKSDILIKQLLEASEDTPTPEKNPKTSHIIPQRGRYEKNDSFASSDDDDDPNKNILDRTFTEDNFDFNSKYLVPGVSWLDSPPDRKPLRIIAKPVMSTPMTNMFNKLSLRGQPSAKKEPRPNSLERKDDEKQKTANDNNIFKTPCCKNTRYIPSSSTAQKLQLSERSAIPSTNNLLLSATKRQLEPATPKQKLMMQPNKNVDTPRQTSILEAAIRRDFNTPRPTLSSTTKNDHSNSNSIKKSDAVVLREKNMNVIGLERQKSKEIIINEGKQLNVQRNNQIKQMPNKHSNISEIKPPMIKQLSHVEERQLPNKQLNSNYVKQSSINDEKLPIKQSNTNDLKQSNSNELKQTLNKQPSEEKPVLNKPCVSTNIPTKSLQESTFRQLKVRGKDYIVINKIGEGGSGQVYRCLEQDTLQDRAIKVVNLNVDPTTVNSYINEVKMLKELQGNDRVIRMYDYEQVNQNLFVVMEKGDVDFSIFLRNITSTSEPQIQTHVIVCYWIEMLKCVREIHKKGIIHSDLKPSNFLIVGGRLKLIDFGIASRLTAEMTSVIKNITVGTFNYISPEALLDSRDSPIDENPQLRISYKSDVWSLGCILYQMVYKRTPFQTVGNMYAKFAVITDRNHKIEYPQVAGVPSYLIGMIKMCLVYDMRSRPTVEDLLNMYYNGNYC